MPTTLPLRIIAPPLLQPFDLLLALLFSLPGLPLVALLIADLRGWQSFDRYAHMVTDYAALMM